MTAQIDSIAAERSLPDDLRELALEARGYAEAELAFQKARAGYVAGQAPKIALYAVFAFLFVFFALGGLVVGLIIALAPWLTAWGSTAAVCGVLLLGAAAFLWLAWRKWRIIAGTFAAGVDL